MKGLYYLVTQEHKDKIEQSNLNPQVCYQFLARFFSYNREEPFVFVSGTELKSIYSNYKQYVDFFIYNKIIFVDNTYKVGELTRRYRLREEYKSPIMLIPMTNKRYILEKINTLNMRKKEKKKLLSKYEVFKQMKSSFVNFSNNLDFELIKKEINNIDKLHNRMFQMVMIHKIIDGDLYFQRNTTNSRLDTNLTNLNNKYKYLCLNNNFTSIDISNSQPYFLYLFLTYFTSTYPLYYLYFHNAAKLKVILSDYQKVSALDFDEIEQFGMMVTSGSFYENLAGKLGVSKKEAKTIAFSILFSKNSSYIKEKKIFKSMFPTICDFIFWFKEEYGYKELAITLQRMESYNVLDNICRIMVTDGIVPITIHDSWIVPTEQVEQALNIINDYFKIKPKLSIDKFSDKQNELFPEYYLKLNKNE